MKAHRLWYVVASGMRLCSGHRRRRFHRLNLRPPRAARAARTTVVNLDALTYAGNLENLRDLEGDPRTCSSAATSATARAARAR